MLSSFPFTLCQIWQEWFNRVEYLTKIVFYNQQNDIFGIDIWYVYQLGKI